MVDIQGVTGVVVEVEHRYSDNDGAYEVVSIQDAEGAIHRLKVISGTVYSMPQGETDDDKRVRMNKHFEARAVRFDAMGTRSGRLLAIIARRHKKIA